MRTENGVMIDLGEVGDVIETADVFAVGFRQFQERLLVDARYDDQNGPLIAVVEPVNSVQERFFWLGARRPTLGMPERFMFFVWPHSVAFLEESGVWKELTRRIREANDLQADEMLAEALATLKAKEREATIAAITGEGYHRVWPSERRRRA